MSTQDSVPELQQMGAGNQHSSRDPQGFCETIFNTTVDPELKEPVLFDHHLVSITVVVQSGIGIKLLGVADGYAAALEQVFGVPVHMQMGVSSMS